jgi:hypothetical protein
MKDYRKMNVAKKILKSFYVLIPTMSVPFSPEYDNHAEAHKNHGKGNLVPVLQYQLLVAAKPIAAPGQSNIPYTRIENGGTGNFENGLT